ncbi:lasso RiPP family leader peptide-containing protein [Gryllotalpicola ginsengisoli]|uniref:lasso RiPP family leader peptide-containing protein n=1 Tax=Gryllotalpicola ginsengisoli TaxID=444608 RepID=UPI0003B6F5E6|nr:lasso RiPP family leader peptide-containing protein [Gryllotalpicola ginsengisoli]
MAYEAPRIRSVGSIAEVTLAEGLHGSEDQWALTVTFDGKTGTISGTFGGLS